MQLLLTPAVKRAQDKYYGGHDNVESAPEVDPLTDREVEFLTARDSFYMATTTETGWPYLQHRGGPPGFIKVLGPNLIGFPDFRGNQQLLTTGNLSASDRVAIFMMDYPRRMRLKILGHAQVLDARENQDLVESIAAPALRARVERVFLVKVISYDWNCPQYITPRFTADEVERYVAPLKERIAELEALLAGKSTDPK